MFSWGDKYISFKDIKGGMEFSDAAKTAGFQDGDIIVSADGTELKMRMDKTLDMNTYMNFADADEVTVERNGKVQVLKMPEDFAEKLIASKKMAYFPILPTIVDSVMPGSNAQKYGLLKGDSIVSLNGKEVKNFSELKEQVESNKSTDIEIGLIRNKELHTVTAYVDTTGLLGFSPVQPVIKHDTYSFLSSFPAGLNLAKETLEGYVAQFRFVFTSEGVKSLGGFGAIGSLFSATWDWQAFWFMTAFLSIILAVMNILPIPALDGGHVMFLLYEVITRRKPNEKFMEYAQYAGMLLLLLLLVYANGNDIYRFLIK
jgi:regulator of sigma E protease